MSDTYVGQPLLSKHLTDLMVRINGLAVTDPFNFPVGMCVDSSGNVYVADSSNDRVLKFTAAGAFLLEWGSSGSGSGQFDGPFDIASDASDALYVLDTGNLRVQKFTSAGAYVASYTHASMSGSVHDLCVLSDGSILVADPGNEGVLKIGVSGVFIDTGYQSPYGIAADTSDNIYVTQHSTYNRVRKYSAAGAHLLDWGSTGSGDGQFSTPTALSAEGSYVYVIDAGNSRVQKFQLDGTFAAKWGSNGSGDGQFTLHAGICNGSSSVYVSDASLDRVSRFNESGTFLSKWTGRAAIGPTTWYAHTAASKTSIGTTAADDALSAVPFVARNLTQMRTAIEAIVAAGHYKNPATGNAYNWTNASADNLYYVAMGDRTAYGATGGARYDWTRSEAAMVGTPLYSIDIGEIEECVTALENAGT